MSLLRDRLERRIAALIKACPRCWGALLDDFESGDIQGHVGQGEEHRGTDKPVPRSAFAPAALAARVEQNVRAAAAMAIDDGRERAAALDRPIVAERWPLFAGPTWTESDEDIAAMVALDVLPDYAEEEGGREPDGWVWPASVAPGDVGDAIAKGGTAESTLMAEALKKGFYSPGRGFSFGRGEQVEIGGVKRGRMIPPNAAEQWTNAHEDQIHEGLLLWSPLGFAVLLAALAEVRPGPLATARTQVIRAPQPVLAAMIAARTGMTKAGHVPAIVDPSGKTFTAAGFRHWQFTGPKGCSLILPFAWPSSTTTKGKLGKMEVDAGIPAREALTGGLLHAYLTTWALHHIQRDANGAFLFDPALVAELGGYALTGRSDRPGSAPTARSGAVRHFAAQLDKLTLYGLAAVGDVKAKTVEPLINRYESPRGKAYQHAPLALHAMRGGKDFTQLPLAVLRLDARDAPIAVGMAAFWREAIVPALDGAGHWRGSLRELLAYLGALNPKQARKHGGTSYLQGLARDIERIAAEGDLGSAHIEGEGPEAIVTLTPSPILATVYEPLRAARLAAAARAEKVAVEVAVRRALPAGRARRAPGGKTAKG